MTKQPALYGTWNSPIKAKMAASALRVQDALWSGDGSALVWLESRGGQSVLVAQHDGENPRDLTDVDVKIRGGIGYGGGDFTLAGETIFFAGHGGRLYALPITGGRPRPITPAFGSCAAPAVSPDGAWVVYVHQYENVDGLLITHTSGRELPRKLLFGTDFVMQPAWHPDGKYLACVTWDKPNMPWDGTELKLVALDRDPDGIPFEQKVTVIAGGKDTAVMQPEFSPDGTRLAYASDQTGWWQLYVYDLKTGTHTQLTHAQAEHAGPAWRQGMRYFGWSSDSKRITFLRNERGFFSLWQLDVETQRERKIDGLSEYSYLTQLSVSADGKIALIAGSSTQTDRLITLEPDDRAANVIPPRLPMGDDVPTIGVIVDAPLRTFIRRRTSAESVNPAALSNAEAITWKGYDGETVHGIYYPPVSERETGIGAPPLIVQVHGGPTSQVRTQFAADVQFFTTRGFAVLAPNHRGSTGYGRAYMLAHRGAWGAIDVDDSASGAEHLAAQGLADPSKFVIMGGSAGGYTVLQSLTDKPGFYKAGVCLYGIANLFTLYFEGADWKFESAYNDPLIGALPEAAPIYRERSPLFKADKISDPVIVFQGEEDNVVPKSQSDAIVAALVRRGVPHEYHVYAGEGHGWRKPETIEAYLNATLKFLQQYVVYT